MKITEKQASQKLQRYQRIAKEAAKQSGRGRIPKIHAVMNLPDVFIKQQGEKTLDLFCYECGGIRLNEAVQRYRSSALMPLETIRLVIGSEGGFTPEEALLAQNSGFQLVTLGSRILRAETAPISAISILMNLTENM